LKAQIQGDPSWIALEIESGRLRRFRGTMNTALQHKRALVTGGSRGIGAAIVKRLAREGADVAFTYVSKPEQANATVKAAQGFGVKALAIQADSGDAKAVFAAVERTVSDLGGIDILVNNAGVAAIAPIDDYRLEDFDRTVAVNLRAMSSPRRPP
jgi:3-oxoacyl-[acyl-carrier protein] reductase